MISLFVHRFMKEKPVLGALVGALVGWVITVLGYSLGRAYIYGTPEYAILKLPFQILQTGVGSALALLLCYRLNIVGLYQKFFRNA